MKKIFFTIIFLCGICYIYSEAQEAKQFILYEDFESIIPPALPAGWTLVDANGDGRTWQTKKFGGHSTSPQCFKYSSDAIIVANDWFFSPSVQLQFGIPYTLTFRYKVSKGAVHKMNAWIGNSPLPAGMTTQIFSNTSLTDTIITELSVGFTAPASGNYYLGFHCFSDANNGFINVDDVTIACSSTNLQLNFVFTKFLLNRGTTPSYNLTETLEGQVILENIGATTLVLNKSFNVGQVYAPETGIAYIVIDPDGDTLDYVLKAEPEPWPSESNFISLYPSTITGRYDDLQKMFWFTKTGTYTVRVLYKNKYQSQSSNAWLGKIISNPITFVME